MVQGKHQKPNKLQCSKFKISNKVFLIFCKLVIEIYLGLGIWNLGFKMENYETNFNSEWVRR